MREVYNDKSVWIASVVLRRCNIPVNAKAKTQLENLK